MVTVPRAQPSVRPDPIRPVYQDARGATLDAFGGGQGKALAQLGDAGYKAALAAREADEERELKQLEIEFSQRTREALYGDGTDQNPGYYSSRGESAVGQRGAVHKQIDDIQKELSARSKSPRVRKAFSLSSAVRSEHEKSGIDKFVQNQRRVAADATSEARLGEAADDAGAAWNDPEVLNLSLSSARAEIQDAADRNGWSPEVRLSKMQEAQTAIHRRVIDTALQHDPAAAEAHFKKYKNMIDGRVHADIQRALEAGTLRQQSQQASDTIIGKFGLVPSAEKEALDAARAIENPKLRDETVTRVAQRYSEARRIDDEARRTAREGAWRSIIGGGSVDQVPPSVLANMDGASVSAMQHFERNRAQRGTGYSLASNENRITELNRTYMEQPEKFAKMDLQQFIPDLEEPDYRRFQELQRMANSSEEREKRRATTYTMANQIARRYLQAANIDPNKEGSQARKANRVFELTQQFVDRMREEGKPITREEIEKGVKLLFLQGETGTGFLGMFGPGASGPFYKFAGTEEARKFVLTDARRQKADISTITGVPEDQIEDVVKGLTKQNLPITLQNIRTLYDLSQSRGR